MGLSWGLSLKFPSDEKNPPPTSSNRLPPPRHRAAKWPDLRSHSESPTPIQPFPNPDTDAPNRLATTSRSDSTHGRYDIACVLWRRRYSPGVTPRSCLDVLVKWLWSQNPVAQSFGLLSLEDM